MFQSSRLTCAPARLAGVCFIAATLAMTVQASAPVPTTRTPEAAVRPTVASYGSLPLSFMANRGQSDDRVRFLARGQGYSLFLTPTEAVLSLRARTPRTASAADQSAVVRMRLVGANRRPQLTGLDPLPGASNFFIGNDPERWQRDVPSYAKVQYTAVYPGIDQIYYGNQRQLEYDFVVAPGADPDRITLTFEGVEDVALDAEGNLVLQTAHGDITQQKPVVYQDIGGRREPVDGHYVLGADDRVGFHVASYDTRQPLVIDPVLSYSTYLGGNFNDVGNAIAVDGAGDAYITGETISTNFPGVNASSFQPTKQGAANSYDVFVTKLNAAGTAIVYSTYLGGSGGDYGEAIAVDSTGSAYVTGQTDSPTTAGPGNVPFPLLNPVQALYRGGGDAFITKISPSGNALVYSTYHGGSGVERGYGIAVDNLGNAYVTGYTNSFVGAGTLSFPIANAFQAQNAGNYDAFVTKLNAAGNALVYSTFLGGNASEHSIYGGAIAVDNAGHAYVGGSTASPNFPRASSSAIQPTNGGGFVDGFVVKFNAAGSDLLYSTYLGGNFYDEVNGLAIDSGGDAYVTGYSTSSNFPTASPLQATNRSGNTGSGSDAFVSRINAAGTALVYSTYLGGTGVDIAYDVALDDGSNAYVAGWTNSSNFPTVQPLQAANGGSGGDAFISGLSAAGSALVYSTYWGGETGGESAYGIALDSVGNVFVTGETNSDDFPIASAFQPAYASHAAGPDAFVVKIAAQPLILEPPTNLVATSIVGNTVTLSWTAPANSITPTGYLLTGGLSSGQTLAAIATGSTATTFTFVAPTGSFYLRMQSAAAGATSVTSNEIRIFVNVPAPPSAPTNLLGLVNGSTLDLAWTNTAAGGTATGLMLDVSGTVALSLSMAVADAFSLANVPAGTYTMSLRAFNGQGVSGSSNSVTLTFPGSCSGAPAPPTAFAVTNSANVITASWGLPASGPAPTGYRLIITGAFTGELALTQRTISGAVGAGTYTLSVVATNACGSGVATAPQSITIP